MFVCIKHDQPTPVENVGFCSQMCQRNVVEQVDLCVAVFRDTNSISDPISIPVDFTFHVGIHYSIFEHVA